MTVCVLFPRRFRTKSFEMADVANVIIEKQSGDSSSHVKDVNSHGWERRGSGPSLR